jgi:hypothetical protein
MLELQRDWARGEIYMPVMKIATEHAGGYGLGIVYASKCSRERRQVTR